MAIQFKIVKKGRYWAMTYVPPRSDIFEQSSGKDCIKIENIIQELQDNQTAKRMSYDTWYWKNQQEMNKWLIFINLKYNLS